MAKGLRSTVKKRNRAKLRASLFGPAYDARTERLSAKLQEVVSQPRAADRGNGAMELDATEQTEQISTKGNEQVEEMDVEAGLKRAKSKRKVSSRNKSSNDVRKISRRKEKNLSVFPKYRLKRYQKSSSKQNKS